MDRWELVPKSTMGAYMLVNKSGEYVTYEDHKAEIDAQRLYWIKVCDEVRSDNQAEIDERKEMHRLMWYRLDKEAQVYLLSAYPHLFNKHKGE